MGIDGASLPPGHPCVPAQGGTGRRPTNGTYPPPVPWHSALFRDTNSNTDYSPSLIRIGVRTIQQLMEMGPDMDCLPQTSASVYKDVAPRLLHPPPPSERAAAEPLLETKVAFWTACNIKKMLWYLMQLPLELPRQTPETWKEWSRVGLPDAGVTFIQQALWHKLPVGTMLAGVAAMRDGMCPGRPAGDNPALTAALVLPPKSVPASQPVYRASPAGRRLHRGSR